MSTISNEEELDLFTFLDFAEIEYCERCGWSVCVRSYGTHNFCRDCVTKMIESGELGVCHACGEVLLVNDMNHVQVDDETYQLYCDDCAVHHITTCSDCGRTILINDSDFYRDLDGRPHYVCRDCIPHYQRCGFCGRLSNEPLVEDMCPSCYKRSIWSGDTILHGYHNWEGRWNFYKNNKITLAPEEDTIYMGVELEIDSETRMSTETTLEGLNRRFHGLVHYERDGSLSNRGIEIITMPMTIEEHMKRKDVYESAFDYVKDRNYECDDHTGLHVHVSTKHLIPKHHNRLLYLLDRWKDEVIKISRRTSHYATYYTISRALDVENCESSRTGRALSEYREWICDHSGHGIFINYNKYPESIEFRMFGGTLDITTFIASIQFVYLCVTQIQEFTLDQLRESEFAEIFKGKYEELDTLMKKVGIIQ